MHIFRKIAALQSYLSEVSKSSSIGLVPTMGALHSGHEVLIETSISENEITICSIFINPTQFNKEEDLISYPKKEIEDIEALQRLGCQVVFIPEAEEIYKDKPVLRFDFGFLDSQMEGAFRPGHFNGVALIVSKLFNIIRPNKSYFGQKDYQQFKIISQLNEDLSFGIELVSVPTVREKSGLAKSSRNLRLTKEGRATASKINGALIAVEEHLLKLEKFDHLKSHIVSSLLKQGISVEYLELVDRHTLMPIDEVINAGQSVVCIAAIVEGIRLIDNRIF